MSPIRKRPRDTTVPRSFDAPYALSRDNASTAVEKKRERLRPFQLNLYAKKGLLACGEGFSMVLHESERLLCIGADRRGQSALTALSHVTAVVAEGEGVAALCADGTVHVIGRSSAEEAFAARLASAHRISLGKRHMAVLMGNGTVLVGGHPHDGVETMTDWKDITDIAAGANFTAGLSSDGQVFLAGGSWLMRDRVSRWSNMVSIVADPESNTLYGIDLEGELHATRRLPDGVCAWKKLVQVSAVGKRLCAVTSSGQLLSTVCLSTPASAEDATYVAVSVGKHHIIALCRDGKLAAWGDNRYGQCRVGSLGTAFAVCEAFSARRRERIADSLGSEYAFRTRAAEAERFAGYLACSERLSACINAFGRTLTSPAFTSCKHWQDVQRLSCGNTHILGLCTNGRVLADGNKGEGCLDVDAWENIREIAAGSYHSVGVTFDGNVCFCGSNEHGQGDVTAWRNIRQVSTTDTYTVGVTFDGQVLVAGLPPFDQQLLTRIHAPVVHVVATDTHVLCLCEDGRAFATQPPDPDTGRTQEDDTVRTWQGIAAIAADAGVSVGLCFGGTVCASGVNDEIRAALSSWHGIVSLDCGSGYVAGLDADGHLHIAGTPTIIGECRTDSADIYASAGTPMYKSFADATEWQDIIAFLCAPAHLLAINRDGQVLACGSDSDGQCSMTTHFTLFRDARTLAGYGRNRVASDS